MKVINIMLVSLLLAGAIGCHKPKKYQNRVAEDLNYRLGKWYSVTDSGTVGTNHNTSLDTIWFLSDSMAGWTGFVLHQPTVYKYMPTYFSDPLHIIYVIRNYSDTTKFDTVTHQCAMTLTGDTMVILWDASVRPSWIQQYVKKID